MLHSCHGNPRSPLRILCFPAAEASRKIGVTQQTYYRWRKEYGGLRIEQAKKLKSLDKENAQLKKLVADLSLDNSIPKEAAEGNF